MAARSQPIWPPSSPYFSAPRTAVTREKVMKVLMVITSHDQLGNTGRKTGFWLEELAAPYYVFKEDGVDITLASPKGGRPRSIPRATNPHSARISRCASRRRCCGSSARQDHSPRQRPARRLRTVFYPGGHGPMWDLAEDKNSIKLIESFIAAGKPIGIVCHSTGALHHVKTADGRFLVQGKKSPASPTARRKRWVSPRSCPSLSKMRC